MDPNILLPRIDLFACKICALCFSTKPELQNHIITHNSEKLYDCPLCHQKLASNSLLRCHMKMHLEEKRVSCEFCGRIYLGMHTLKAHMRTHTGEMPYQCETCDQKFSTRIKLLTHLVHVERKFVMSGTENAKIQSSGALEQVSYVCKICKHMFSSASTLQWHMKKHTKDNGVQSDFQLYKCTTCFENFPSFHTFQQHLQTHREAELSSVSNETPEEPQCHENESKKRTKSKLAFVGGQSNAKKPKQQSRSSKNRSAKVHSRSEEPTSQKNDGVHNQSVSVEAQSNCDKSEYENKTFDFSSKSNPLEVQTNADKLEQDKCLDCTDSIESLNCNGRKHSKKILNSHKHVGSLLCPFCSAIFYSKISFDNHLKARHSHTKALKCNKCYKNFRDKPALALHMECHTDQKPCICSLCKEAFYMTGSRYVYEIDDAIENPVCTKCRITRTQRDKIHVNSNNVYQCEHCSFICNTVQDINAHKTECSAHAVLPTEDSVITVDKTIGPQNIKKEKLDKLHHVLPTESSHSEELDDNVFENKANCSSASNGVGCLIKNEVNGIKLDSTGKYKPVVKRGIAIGPVAKWQSYRQWKECNIQSTSSTNLNMIVPSINKSFKVVGIVCVKRPAT